MILRILIFIPFMCSFLVSQHCDTISIETFENVVSIIKYRVDETKEVFVAEVDLTNPRISIEIFNPTTLTKTSTQAIRSSTVAQRVITAINADFFDLVPPHPVGNCVVNGKPVVGLNETHRSQLAITTDSKILLDSFTFQGILIAKNGTTIIPLQTLNSATNKNFTTLFTSDAGTRKFSQNRKRYILTPLDGEFTLNDSLRYVVSQINSDTILTIRDSLAVLSTGQNDSLISSQLAVNDTLILLVSYSAQHSIHKNMLYITSGWGRLLDEGRNLPAIADANEGLTEKFTKVFHPRTFIGINADTTKLFLCVADGRQKQSEGMTFLDMANFLQFLGATNGMNFDGGGSSTLFFDNRVINSPSDKTGERPVANTLQVKLALP